MCIRDRYNLTGSLSVAFKRLLSPRLPATRSISPSLSTSKGNKKFHQPCLSVIACFVNFPCPSGRRALLLMNTLIPPHSQHTRRSLSPSLSMSYQIALVTIPTCDNSFEYLSVTSVNFPVPSFCSR